MSLTQVINSATSGLQVTQQALSIVAGNVANAQTPGYIRKSLDQIETAAGTSIGVRSAGIQRALDQLIQTQLRTETSGGSYADSLAKIYQQLQSLYGSPGSSSGLDTLFNNFTTALQNLSTSPSSFSVQSTAVNSAQLLSNQLNSMSDGVQLLRSTAEQAIAADVQTANNALAQIVDINKRVASTTPNDAAGMALMDQRDQAIDQLAKLMDIKVVQGDSNQVYVYTRNGTQLVGTGDPAQLTFDARGTITPNALYSTDPTKRAVGTITLTLPNGNSTDLIAAGAIQSGEISALIQMRDQILPQAQTQLDELAAQMAQALSDKTVAGTPVPAPPQSGFSVDVGGLQNGNTIHLTYTDALSVQHTLSIIRVDDPAALPLPNTATADPNDRVIGINFSGGMASVVSQLNTGLASTGLQFSNPAGTTLQVLNDVANTVSVNALSETVTVTSLTSGSPQLPLFVDGANPYTGAITKAGSEELGFAQRIAVNSAVLADPSTLVTYSTAPPTAAGDATRPNFLHDQMANTPLLFSPATGIGSLSSPMRGTLSSYIGQMMSQQALAASNADSLKQGQDVVVNALQQRFNDASGVNIDTEMANLLTLQNTYAANARIFGVLQQMFTALLNM
jgi:flagellar hook-associated protein 1 FlgK